MSVSPERKENPPTHPEYEWHYPMGCGPRRKRGEEKCSFVQVFSFSTTPTHTGLPNYNMRCDLPPITSLPIIMDVISSTVS